MHFRGRNSIRLTSSDSTAGYSKTMSDTLKLAPSFIPTTIAGDVSSLRVSYLIYPRSDVEEDVSKDGSKCAVIGFARITKPVTYGTPMADHFGIPDEAVAKAKLLVMEAGYALLPKAWGKGYATEALNVVVDAYEKCRSLWSPPYDQVSFRAITGETNPQSCRVLEKSGFKLAGRHGWEGPDVFLAGAWQPPRVMVFVRLHAASSDERTALVS